MSLDPSQFLSIVSIFENNFLNALIIYFLSQNVQTCPLNTDLILSSQLFGSSAELVDFGVCSPPWVLEVRHNVVCCVYG